MKRYNGLVQLEVKKLAGLAEAATGETSGDAAPQTFAAFCGSSGKSGKNMGVFRLTGWKLAEA